MMTESESLPEDREYSEILNFLYSQLPMFHRIGAAAYKPGLDNTIELCRLVGNPQQSLKTVHVAGTNGKGSTSHLIASVLQEAGYKTGLYTSPHLKDFRERIRINGEMISKQKVIAFVQQFKSEWSTLRPSFFEITVALAFWYFNLEKVDIAVIETGLGGRLDSTNVIDPEVAVITRIGKDHMNLLGDTIEKIAAEKAGIIKPGRTVVLGMMPESALAICQTRAVDQGSACIMVSEKTELLDSPLQGMYQRENLRTANVSISVMRDLGWKISEQNLIDGFKNVVKSTGLMGRWQVLGERPLTIADVAHNEDGIQFVFQQVSNIVHRQLHIVLGMVSDKDISSVLALFPREAKYYFCKADIPRGMEAESLAKIAGSFDLHGEVYTSVAEAFKASKEIAGDEDMILVTGSFFTVAEVI